MVEMGQSIQEWTKQNLWSLKNFSWSILKFFAANSRKRHLTLSPLYQQPSKIMVSSIFNYSESEINHELSNE